MGKEIPRRLMVMARHEEVPAASIPSRLAVPRYSRMPDADVVRLLVFPVKSFDKRVQRSARIMVVDQIVPVRQPVIAS